MTQPLSQTIIEQYFDLLKSRDREGLLALLSPNIKVTYYGQSDQLPWAGEFHGVEGFDQFFSIIAEHLSIVEVEKFDFISDADKVVVQSRGIWQVKVNGELVHGGMVNVFTLEDQKISAYEVYADTAAFLRALDAE